MPLPNPCCMQIPLQTGVKIAAAVSMVFDAILFMVSLLGIIAVSALKEEAVRGEGLKSKNIENIQIMKKDLNTSSGFLNVALSFSIIFLICALGHFAISVVLFLGAHKRNYSKCRLWFNVTIVFLFFYTITRFMGATSTSLLLAVSAIVIKVYFLYVVFAFMIELKCSSLRSNRHEEANHTRELPTMNKI